MEFYVKIVLTLILTFSLLHSNVQCLQNPYCELTCDNGADPNLLVPHTVCERNDVECGPDPQRCGPDFQMIKLTDTQRQMILDLHNGLRCRVGLGREGRGKQPPASNMRVMSYDKELEFIAQCWANACNGAALIHDGCRKTSRFEHVGQNIGYVNSSVDNVDFNSAMQQIIRFWYEEVAIFDQTWVIDTRDRGPKYKVGHYTQMMWADTHRIGCAAAYYTVKSPEYGKSYEFSFVCNYGPGGNYVGLPVYKLGIPGSACPDRLRHNNKCGMCGSFLNATKYDDGFNPFFKFY